MNINWLCVFITSVILATVFSVEAKQVDYPRDTSYTIHSAYHKYMKNYPQIEVADPVLDDQINIQKNITYKFTGTRDLRLDVFSPKDMGKASPAVVMVHGGGWISGDRTLIHPMAKALAEIGFVAATVEYRLSPEAEYPAAVYDIKTAVKWLKDHAVDLQVDTHKVAIMGTSAGGQLAALVGATAEDPDFEDPADSSQASTKVQAIVDIDGVLAFIHPDSQEGAVAGKWLGGDQNEARKKWIEASPITHVGADTPPMLFVGSSYPRFLAGREKVTAILDEHGIENRTHLFENAPHSFWLFHPWFEPTIDHTVAFLNEVLTD
ncbi:MAG: esterase [Balneola sp.]|nr:esterase [Balneola sp.]|tara:strand:+ start:24304 stop:25266 length:963 start_codon:yes stop_codon:yes gene_type:complete